jgi:hypothetical protein
MSTLTLVAAPAAHLHPHLGTNPPAGALDMRRLNEWLSNLLQEKGADIYRSKGILNVAGTDEK